jgi:TRAP-type transport system periplasmic protein
MDNQDRDRRSRTAGLSGVLKARRSFLTGTAVALASFSIVKTASSAAQFEFRAATQYTLEHPASVRLTQMWAAIERESGGRIRTQFFPNSALGGDVAMFSQMRVGAITFVLTGAPLSSVVPAADITSLGFAFKDPDEALRCMDGALGDFLRAETAAKGIHMLNTTWNSGMREIGSNSRPIQGPDDLRGFKIKVVGKMSISLFKDLGAIPIELGLSEVYTGLQTKLVDGEDTPLLTIETSRLFEVNKYISLTNHSWSGLWLLANGDIWKSLPPDLVAIVERNNTKYATLERRDSKLLDAVLADKLSRQGVTINRRVEQAVFRSRLRSYYDTWAGAFGAKEWGILESSLGHRLV